MSSRVVVDSTRGPLWLLFPSLADKQYAHFIYDKALKAMLGSGICSVEQTISEHKAINLWSDAKDAQLEKLPSFIADTVSEIDRTKGPPSQITKLKNWLKTLERLYYELLSAKNSIIVNSAEFIANTQAMSYIIYKSFININLQPLWANYETTLLDSPEFIQELIDLYTIHTTAHKESVIRALARYASWRIRWNAGKNNVLALFNRPMADLSTDQFMLIYWSQVYDMVYESLERPPDEIIENDEKLDKWLKEESEKRVVETKQKFYSKSSSKSLKDIKSGEIFCMIDGEYNKDGIFVPYDAELADKRAKAIEDSNTPSVKALKQRENAILQKNKGVLLQVADIRKDRHMREGLGGNIGK